MEVQSLALIMEVSFNFLNLNNQNQTLQSLALEV